MKKNSNSILILNEVIDNDDHDPYDEYLNMKKKNKGKKVKIFEKYKPKTSNSKKEETNLEGAENKVKSLLSLFLHNIEVEGKKDIGSNHLFLEEIELAKRIQKNDRLGSTKKNDIYHCRRNSNILYKKDEFNKIDTISSFNKNYIRANSLQFSVGNKKNAIKTKNSVKKNQEKSNFYKNKRKGSLAKNKINIKYLNFKSSVDISSNLSSKNNIKLLEKTKTNSLENRKNNLKTIKSIDVNYRPIKKNIKNSPIIQKYPTVKPESEFSKSKLKKKLKNFLKTPNKKKNHICKDESSRDSSLSENSKTILKKLTDYKNEIKIEDQLKASSSDVKNLEGSDLTNSNVNNNKTNSIIKTSNISANNSITSKKSSINISINSNKNSLVRSVTRKKRRIVTNKSFRGLMRAITTSSSINKDLLKKDTNKLHRVETALKNLQEQIKKTIILRPEDLDLNLLEETKIKNEKTITGKEKNESKINASSKSTLSHFSKKNELDISKRNSSDIKKQEGVPTVLHDTDKNSDTVYKATSKDLLKNETEEELQEDVSRSKLIKFHEKYRIFIHRNLVYDSLDDEEVEDEVSNYIYFNPDSKFILVFDAVLLISTLYSIFWIPFYLAYNLNFCKKRTFTIRTALDLFIEFINLLDLIFGFFKAYYNFEEQLIKKNSLIAKKYLGDWFLIDLISTIPFYSIFKFQEKTCNSLELSKTYYNNILHNLNYLYMCNRVLKMIKIFFNNQAYNYLSINYQEKRPFLKLIINIIRMSCLFFVFHFCACLYIFIGRNSYPNWILYTKLDIKSFGDIYVCAIYMLLTTLTTVGYGDITCYSFHERIFQLILLVIGIMSYSYAVSSFSSYVQKENEKSAEYEKRKDILDDIKLNNPNLPDNLYDRILRYLKYKNLSEKRDKSIILECLPVGLKNNLVYEMYKPIIQNFIFFKNFENTDFIVRVILCFRPIIAIKNDILVNEGEIIEDIMFMKKGILSVELPINIKNPQENTKKYLNMTFLKIDKGPNLEKVGNSTIVNSNIKSTNILSKTVMPGEDIKKTLTKTKTDNKKKYDETTYVKILNIRENEHFGDVLMFLEKRSPLRVRVRSKKAELFFLKKTDAVKISSSYQNIWRRINKKSVFNFEQIKKSIHKIVEIYGAFKTIKTLRKNNENIKKGKTYKKTMQIIQRKLKLESEIIQRIRSKSEKKLLSRNYKYFNNSIIKESNLSRSKSVKTLSNKTPNLYSSSFSDYSDSDDSDDSDESDSAYYYQTNNLNRKKKRTNSRLLNTYNGNYKFYKGANNKPNLNNVNSIIDEEPGNEDTITPMKKNELSSFNKTSSIKYNLNKTSSIKYHLKKTASIQQGFEKSALSKDSIEGNSKSISSHKKKHIDEKEELEEEKINDDSSNRNNCDDKKKNKINVQKIKGKKIKNCEKGKYSKKEMYSSSDFDQNKIIYESKISAISSDENEISNQTSDVKEINENGLPPFKKEDINREIYSNETFSLSRKEESLFSRKIKLSSILNQLQNRPNNFIQSNNKISFLLDSDKESNLSQNNINRIQIINNSKENINTNFNLNTETNEIKMNTNNYCFCKCHSKAINSIKLNNKIILPYSIKKIEEIEYKSLYENLNQITNNKYSSNFELQNKVKNIITELSLFPSSTSNNTNILIKKQTISSFHKNQTFNSNNQNQKFTSSINPLSKFKNTTSLFRINSITNQKINENNNINKKHKNKKRNSTLTKRSETFNNNPVSKIVRSSSIDNYKPKINKFQTGIDNSFNNNDLSFANKFGIKAQKTLKIKQEFEKEKINNNENITLKKSKGEKIEFPKAIEQKKTMGMSPNFFSKKKKGNLLSQINLNIEKTNQNLNNPEEFYTNYFNSILGNSSDQPKFDSKRYQRRGSAICFSNKIEMSPTKNLKNKKKK